MVQSSIQAEIEEILSALNLELDKSSKDGIKV